MTFSLLISLQKELDSYLPWFTIIALQIYRDIIKEYRKMTITIQKILFKKNIIVIEESLEQLCARGNHNRCRNGRDKGEQTNKQIDRQMFSYLYK